MNPVDLFPFVRDQGERNTCLSIALTDGHQIARRSGPTLSAEYLHFCASRRAGVGLNDAVSLSAGCTALADDGQPAEEACPYSTVLRATNWQLPSGINILWRRNTMVLSGVASGSLRESLILGLVCVVILRINDPFILGNTEHGLIDDFQGPDRGTHAILAVGISEQSTAFLIRNSWGTDWGQQGYGWISEGYLEARSLAVVGYSEESS